MPGKDQKFEVSIPNGPDLVIESIRKDTPPLSPAEADRIHIHIAARELRSHLDTNYPRLSAWVPQRVLSAVVRFQDRKKLPSAIHKSMQPWIDQIPHDPDARTTIRITGRPPVGPNA